MFEHQGNQSKCTICHSGRVIVSHTFLGNKSAVTTTTGGRNSFTTVLALNQAQMMHQQLEDDACADKESIAKATDKCN